MSSTAAAKTEDMGQIVFDCSWMRTCANICCQGKVYFTQLSYQVNSGREERSEGRGDVQALCHQEKRVNAEAVTTDTEPSGLEM